jgi:hypothetical protein
LNIISKFHNENCCLNISIGGRGSDKKYAKNTKFNWLIYDRDEEERFVTDVITDDIYNVGELLYGPQNISAMFLRCTSMNSEFEQFNKLRFGLQKVIMESPFVGKDRGKNSGDYGSDH